MITRPIYVGIGECACGRVDVKLYHVPGTPVVGATWCALCLDVRGYKVAEPRTADDIADIDGKPMWMTPRQKDIDLGHGHVFSEVLGTDDQLVGWLHTHPDKRSVTGVLCQSFCAVRPLNGAPVHQVVCLEPLTLTPSLKCRTCGAHGNVTNGTWEPLA